MPTVFDLSGVDELRPLSAVIRALTLVMDDKVERLLIVGATARELILHYAYKLPQGRRTVDLDIAVVVETWQEFHAFARRLVDEGAQHDRRVRHRFRLLDWTLDILPFGGVEKNGLVLWPPDNDNAMSVIGFEEASLHAFEVILPSHERVFVASPAGLLILKLIAWRERHRDRLRDDAIDIRALLDSYGAEWNQERLYEEADDLLQHFGYDNALAGAALLGRDVAAIAKSSTLARIRSIVHETLTDESFVLPAEMGGQTTDNIKLLEALLFGVQDAALSRR